MTTPQIQRCNLASVILQLMALGICIRCFSFSLLWSSTTRCYRECFGAARGAKDKIHGLETSNDERLVRRLINIQWTSKNSPLQLYNMSGCGDFFQMPLLIDAPVHLISSAQCHRNMKCKPKSVWWRMSPGLSWRGVVLSFGRALC